jgi:8-oxo-dGTP diphosphatase
MNSKNSNNLNKTGPLVAVDTVVFTIFNGNLSVLLIQIDSGPYKEKWAVPGGLVKIDEDLDDAAVRVLSEKANIKNLFLEQLYTFGELDRDVRDRSISVAYFALVSNPDKLEISTQEYYKAIDWLPVNTLPEMAFDHKKIIETAHERLKGKLSYTNIAYSLLPKEFTLTQLQRVYEVILGRSLDKRNFRKKINSLDFVEELDKRQKDVTHRPAKLYKFKNRNLEIF